MQQNLMQLTGVDLVVPTHGIEGAKAYPLGLNCRVPLFDDTEDVFYIKSTDANGQQVLLSSANNNYETAQLINQQTGQLVAQNNTNLINAIQGFNSLQQQISSLSAHPDTCCCSIKTQMLQDKLDEANAKIVAQQNEINNANQTQTILNTLGRFVAWAGSGSQAIATAQG